MQWYNDRLNEDDYVLGCAIFGIGMLPPWDSFETLGPTIDRIAAIPKVTPAASIPSATPMPTAVSILDREKTFAKVKGHLVEQLGVDEDKVTLEANFREDLKADSLDLMELITAFKEEFGIAISDEQAQGITTVGQVVDYLVKHLRE